MNKAHNILQSDGSKDLERPAKVPCKAGRSAAVSVVAFPWDMGPRTKRQDDGKTFEPVRHIDPDTGKATNPNRVVRARRQSWIERYAKCGKINTRQRNIAYELFEASSGVDQKDPLSALKIDRMVPSSDPEAARVDRKRKFFRMWDHVPVFARPVMSHVVLEDHSIRSLPGDTSSHAEARHLGRLQRGLDALADAWR